MRITITFPDFPSVSSPVSTLMNGSTKADQSLEILRAVTRNSAIPLTDQSLADQRAAKCSIQR